MSQRSLLVALIFSAGSAALAQTFRTPPTFRLVTPHGPGSITVSTGDGWEIERFVLYDKGTRSVLLMKNSTIGINLSYILSNDETFDYSKESCKNDVLGPVIEGPLAKATLTNKQNSIRSLPNGQTLDIGSYLIVKNEGLTLNQQNVFGFIAESHTCAEIHLSRAPFVTGEEHLFDAALDNFRFDPAYSPTSADYSLMAGLLPPGMAAAYSNVTAAPKAGNVPAGADLDQSLTFALPGHPGYAHMDAPNFSISELSAKPNGQEFGIRAQDKKLSGAEVLGFLFVTNPPQRTSMGCRDWMLRSEKTDGVKNRNIQKTYEETSASGVPVAMVDYEQTKAPKSAHFVRRFFAAQGDLCLDVAVVAENSLMAATTDTLYKTLEFDAAQQPNFNAKFSYAQVLFDHQNPLAAAPIYASSIELAAQTDNPVKWRRIATDQASMSYGMAGDLAKSRALNEAAIAKDPDYPLYYYNLACADAESGDATAAETHLQQAFDRRQNVLKGEKMPDPTTDDSILKLKNNKAFWNFVQALPAK